MMTIIRSILSFSANLMLALAGFALVCVAIERFYFGIPAGVPLIPYCAASFDRGFVTSPFGKHCLQVIINDAGAAHSGSHKVWIIREYPFGYKRVVAEGYLNSPRDEIPVTWIDEDTCEFSFEAERHGSAELVRIKYSF